MNSLVGQKVMEHRSKRRGIIVEVLPNYVKVDFDGSIVKFAYPAAFGSTLILENQKFRAEFEEISSGAAFEQFRKLYTDAIRGEKDFLKKNGGRRYKIIDGERIAIKNDTCIYSFDTDTEFHFPEGTVIKVFWKEEWISAYVLSCEEFTLVIQINENLGERVPSIEFTSEPWQLMDSLIDRIGEINISENSIAYMLACTGRSRIDIFGRIRLGQDYALRSVFERPIIFIWGPPSTGKTTTLAKIALEELSKGKRVLMLSYSNVSVDGALLKVADMSDYPEGSIIRYGYPRMKELLEDNPLTSYTYVLKKMPELSRRYSELNGQKKRLRKKDIRRTEINKELNSIRSKLSKYEKELIQNASFVATTVSKAIVDKAIYLQNLIWSFLMKRVWLMFPRLYLLRVWHGSIFAVLEIFGNYRQ